MYSIWGFALQTIEVSILAVLLVIIKNLFKDKLSSKWQYGVWGILFIRLCIPAGIRNTFLFPDVTILLETLKSIIESNLGSNYILSYEVIQVDHIFPIIKGLPNSITDFIFIGYVFGVVVCIIKYILQYLQIKNLLKFGYEDENVTIHVNHIASKYNCKSCKVIILKEVPTAFVYGSIQPILVLPSENVDEKIILHELLHVQSFDGLQSMIWSILSCFHWINPLMIYVFRQIKNDMESLCDQRVLERLSGEQRREYGRILLDMCSDAYASSFGTTSISNGTKHIRTRIEAIVRFKKYPKGMSLVSVCIIFTLIPFTLGGTSKVELLEKNIFLSNDEFTLARGRLSECNTVAGAIDTFVKGIDKENQKYIISVTSNENRKDFVSYYNSLPFDTKHELGNDDVVFHEIGIINYYVLNINKNKNGYEAIIAIQRNGAFKDSQPAHIFDYIPIQVVYENGYKVNICDDIFVRVLEGNAANLDYPFDLMQDLSMKAVEKDIKSGHIDIQFYNGTSVKQEIENTNWFGGWHYLLNPDPNPNAQFEDIQLKGEVLYDSNLKDVYNIGIASVPVSGEFEDFSEYQGDVAGSSSNGTNFQFKSVDKTWNQQVRYFISNYIYDEDYELEDYNFRIYKNYKIVDEFVIELGD